MKSFALFAAICAVTLSAGAMKTANAATIKKTDNFTASGFAPSGSPADLWTGSFTITFDPTVSSSGALNAFSSNLLAGRYGTFTFVVDQSGELTIRDRVTPARTITVTDPPATTTPSYQSLALLIQFVAAGFHEQNGIPIVASSRTEINSNGETFLIQPHH